MNQEKKELLFKDLCARLPYKVKVFFSLIEEKEPIILTPTIITSFKRIPIDQNEIYIKPYLRPMSSMTEEEQFEYGSFDGLAKCMDWLNEHHFDYRGLIPMGLALEALKGMYN